MLVYHAGGTSHQRVKVSSKSWSDAQQGILKVNPCIVVCSQCWIEVCLALQWHFLQKHNISVFNNTFSVACNFLDEQNGSKTDFNNDLYKSIDSDGYNVSYICVSCRPFFLKSVKIEHDYRKAQTMFEEKQESVINHSSLSDCATPTKPPKEMDHSIPTSSFNLDI